MRILELARAAGGFTPQLLDDLYRDDPAGRAAHDAEAAQCAVFAPRSET